MTTIVGIQGDGYAVIGTDTRISSFDHKGNAYQYTHLGAGSSKIANVSNRYLIGAAGDVRAINLLHHAFHPPIPPTTLKGKKLDTFITTKIIPNLRELFDEHGYSAPETKESTHIAEHDSTLILAVNATIYVIEGDYSWTPDNNGYYAIGTGSSYALGALTALVSKRPQTAQQAKRIVLKALNTAAKYDPYTGSPHHTYIQEQPQKTTPKTK